MNELVTQLMRSRGSESIFKGRTFPKNYLACEHDIFFCPAMDLMTVGAGEARAIKLRVAPSCFLNGLASGGETAGRGAAHENAFNGETGRWGGGAGEIKFAH
jgi:hypothetical protein